MKLLLGPILTIGECRTEVWKFHVNLLFGDVEGDEPPKLSLDFGSEAGIRIGGPERTATFCDGAYACWSWPVSVDRAQKERWLHYALVPESGTAIRGLPTRSDFKGVAIPALGELPRCAFFSCNGLSDPKDKRRVGDLNAVWQRMVRRHFDAQDAMPADGHGGYHLLIGAGDPALCG